MTPEKLEELEKLEAAATPGPWETSEDLDIGASDFQIPVTYDDGSEVMPGYTRSMRVVSLPYGQPDTWPRHNAALICTLRNNARDLFAALREAWRERDEARRDSAVSNVETEKMIDAYERVCGERDEARKVAGAAIKAGGEIIKERDEARAALEWQSAATKALSESQERLAQEVKDARASLDAAYSKGRADERDFSRVVEERLTKERDEARAALRMLVADMGKMTGYLWAHNMALPISDETRAAVKAVLGENP
jgi:hypothetical protein